MTMLARQIAARIYAHGPMTLATYMETCLLDPRYGYYATRDPFGQGGDFTTAPEISQIFGELLGLAIGQSWLDQGAPSPVTLAEPGPGRGTLMADMTRSLALVPGFDAAAQVTLIEASTYLRAVQARRLGALRHIDDLSMLAQQPLFMVANEFFDALPIRQFQRVEGGWAERMVSIIDGQLGFALGPVIDLQRRGEIGEIYENCPVLPCAVAQIAQRIADHGGAAIIVDYGTWNGRGDSFQAVRCHRAESPFAHPGEADLTAHVDFAAIAAAALRAGAQVSGMVCQGDLLMSLGAQARASALTRAGDGDAQAALKRLTDAAEMGHLFKAVAIWPQGAPDMPGFAPAMRARPSGLDGKVGCR